MTKIFLFVAIIIFLVPPALFISRQSGLQAKTSAKLEPGTLTKPSQTIPELIRHTLEATVLVEKININLPFGEDDGNTHVFHFDRLKGRRRRIMLCLLARSIVIIAHLSWLLREVLHSCHY